jgi:hypothetical protein
MRESFGASLLVPQPNTARIVLPPPVTNVQEAEPRQEPAWVQLIFSRRTFTIFSRRTFTRALLYGRDCALPWELG